MALSSKLGRFSRSINAALDDSAAEWQTALAWARFHFWMPLALSLSVLASKVYQPAYHFFIQEDGLLEWGTFLFAAMAAFAAGRTTCSRATDGYPVQAIMYGMLMLALIFLAGEEISWGQRILGFETPDSLQGINKKNEANLHNIGRFLSWTPLITLVAGLLGSFAWTVNRRIRIERLIEDGGKYFIPPYFVCTSFLVVLLFSIAQFTLLPLTNTQSTRFAEVSEFCLAYGCAVFNWLVASRARNLVSINLSEMSEAEFSNSSPTTIASESSEVSG